MLCWNWLKEAIFPVRCIICKQEGKWLCSKHNHFCCAPENKANFAFLDEIFASTAYYDKTSKKLVEYFKFRGFSELADIMTVPMSSIIINNKLQEFTLIPIPLHWSRKLWRGFNQAEKLARSLQKQFPMMNLSTDLKRVQRTRQQAKLQRNDRLINVEQAFRWMGENVPQKILLIDDVVASGSTLNAAAKSLKQVGAKNVTGLVFARGGKPCQNLNNEN